MSSKRSASSPLGSESNKKSRLRLTDEELKELHHELDTIINENFPQFAELKPEDVPTRALVLAFRTAALYLVGTGCASTIVTSWLDPGFGEERIKHLSRDAQLELASIWLEARAKGDWERFANHRALGPSDRSSCYLSTQFHADLLEVKTPIVESRDYYYFDSWELQVAGTSIRNQKYYIRFRLPYPPATERSWEHPFKGEAAEALWEHIKAHYNPADDSAYKHYAAIVQSSGMGKSRTVDELAKDHFVIPLNLREAKSTGACGLSPLGSRDSALIFLSGYPPPDHRVHEYLTTAQAGSQHAYIRAVAFLGALFQHTAETLPDPKSSLDYVRFARRFRSLMTEGQKMMECNQFRVNFYNRVIEKATMLESQWVRNIRLRPYL